MQVEPFKPKLKPPGAKRLKLKCDILLSTSAFNFNLRRYNEVTAIADAADAATEAADDAAALNAAAIAEAMAGAYIRPLFSST